MYPTFFPTLTANSSVTDLLGADETRVYPHAKAPQGVVRPYVTHQIAAGSPQNYLSGDPDTDAFRIQFNCYANSVDEAREVAGVIRTALKGLGYFVSFNGDGTDPQTKKPFYSFDFDFRVAATP